MAFDYGDKVRAMLAMADDDRLPEAARASYRAKAEDFMRRYHIDLTERIASNTADAPISFTVTVAPRFTHLVAYYRMIVRQIADHCGVMIHWLRDDDAIKVTMVGFEGDIRYADFLWAGAYLMMSTRIDPRWDQAVSENENIWRLRNAGIGRKEIANAAWGYGAGHQAKNRSKVQRIYLAESKARGEVARAVGLGHNAQTYQDAYAREFTMTLSDRLRMARDAANSVGGALNLAGRDDKVRDAFYGVFPQYRPAPTADTEGTVTYVNPRDTCDRCAKASSGYCRGHNHLKPRTWTQGDQARWDRQHNSSSARAGATAGAHAAEGVVIQRGHTTANRLDESGRAIEG